MPRHVPSVTSLPVVPTGPVVLDGVLMTPQADGSWTSAARGEKGDPGPGGNPGPAGPQGVSGPEGPVGPQGPTGPAGPQGPQGPQGAAGANGADGRDGTPFLLKGVLQSTTDLPVDAPVGDAYFVDSSLHAKADSGWIDLGPVAQGPAGPVGQVGPEGPQGPPGPQGPEGARGERGFKGDTGPAGPSGGGAGGLRMRGGYNSSLAYRPGDVIAYGRALWLATCSIPALDAMGARAFPGSAYIPRGVRREDVRIPRISSRGTAPGAGIVRHTAASRTALLSYSAPTTTNLNPANPTIRRHVDDLTVSYDGLLMEFQVPEVAGARPVAAYLGLPSFGGRSLERIFVQEITGAFPAQPTHLSVGIPTTSRKFPGAEAYPQVGLYLGSIGPGYIFWGGNGGDTVQHDAILGARDGSSTLSWTGGGSVVLLVTLGGGFTVQSDSERVSSVDSAVDGTAAPHLVIEYAPEWELIRGADPSHSVGTFQITSVAAISDQDPSTPITPVDGKITIPARGTLLLGFSGAMVGHRTVATLSTPSSWGGSQLSAAFVKSTVSLSGITWQNAPDAVIEAAGFGGSPTGVASVWPVTQSNCVAMRSGLDTPQTVNVTLAQFSLKITASL